MGFRYLEEGPTADLLVEAYGSTLGEAFANAALAMFNAMTPLEKVEPRISRVIELENGDLEGLLYDFLDELLYINDTENLIFSQIDVDVDAEKLRLKAQCRGEPFNPEKHEAGAVVKAVTFHQMKIEETDGQWRIRVVFDL
ncbi:archease [Candidatus Bathyarchaeota archaeon]|nr:MAG: archease [Candidatus Bathyarchaeota archaeon]